MWTLDSLKKLQTGVSLQFDNNSLRKFKIVSNPTINIQTAYSFLEKRSELQIYAQELYDGNVRLTEDGLCSAYFMEWAQNNTTWGSQNVKFAEMNDIEQIAQICLTMRNYDM